MTHPLLTRAHLEALLIAFVLLDPELLDRVDDTRLSPAAHALCAFAATHNVGARACLQLGVEDEYQERLALRVGRLTMDELCWYPVWLLVELVNQLPQLAVTLDAMRRSA